MDAERWREVRKLLDGALDRDGAERAAFVAAIADADLRADVERLLARERQEVSLLDRPAAQIAASALAGGAAPRDWDREQIGRRIGPFQLDDLLGSGGMGTVYRAHRVDGRFEQTVAIKLVLTAHPGMRDRFRKEQEILAGLRHPHIAQLIDGGETEDGIPYLAMEYVAGLPITEYCRNRLPDVSSRLRLVLRVAGALIHAHRNLVIHRDIKPSNILVTDDGHPMLLDFGIAKLVGEDRFRPATQQRIGPMTPAYAAPEQFRGGAITVATDVYQLGALAYRLVTGRLPFDADADDPLAWGRAVLESEPVTLGRALAAVRKAGDAAGSRDAVRTLGREVNRDLDAIVRTAMARDPARRYSSMDALVADIEAFLDGRPVAARRGGSLYAAGRFVRRHAWSVGLGAVAALGLVATTTVALLQAQAARVEAERARAAVEFVNEVFRAADPNNGPGGLRTAGDLLEIAGDRMGPMLGAHPDLRGPLNALVAGAWFNLGRTDRAYPLFAAAIDDLRRDPGTSPLELASILQRGAAAAQRNGELARSRAWADEAERLAVGDSPGAVAVRDGLAFTRWATARDLGDADGALALALASLAEADRAPEPERSAMRNGALNRAGTSLVDLGRHEEAEPMLRESLELARRLYGEDHFRTLRARQALGWSFTERGDPARALAELEPVGERIRETNGEASQDYGNNLYNRANAYRALGQSQRAIEAYLGAAKAFAASAAPRAGQIGWAMWNAAVVQGEAGDHAAARVSLDAVAHAWDGSIPEDAPVRAAYYADVARNRLALGDAAEAERQADRALSLQRRSGPRSAALADLLALIARIAEARGDARRAAVGWADAAAMLESVAPARAADAAAWRALADRLSTGG